MGKYKKQLLDAYDLVMQKLQEHGMFDEWAKNGDLEYDDFMDELIERMEPNEAINPDHANVTKENQEASYRASKAADYILDDVATYLIMKGVTEDDKDKIIDDIKKALKSRTYSEWSSELPKKLYRGVARDTSSGMPYKRNKGGYSAGSFDPEVDGFDPVNGMVFVTSEPSVAASYAREGRFEKDFEGKPSNYGDVIYEINTAGLDPSLFTKDRTSSIDEVNFGPQYIYHGKIPQEDVEYEEGYVAPRIRKMHYLSDGTLKEVKKSNKAITSALKGRFI